MRRRRRHGGGETRRSRPGIGLRRTLAISSGAVTIMVVVGFIVPLALTLRTIAYDQATASAGLEARSIAELLLTNPGAGEVRSVVDQVNSSGERQVQLVPSSGPPVGAELSRGSDLTEALGGASVIARTSAGGIVDVPVRTATGTEVVRVFVPASQVTHGLGWAWLILGIVGFTLVVLAMVVADRLARSITRPVADLEAVATTMSHGQLEVRAEVRGPKEIQSVALAVNDLGRRIALLLQAEREAAADVSHRLRTPLTALQLHVESLDDPAVREVLLADSGALATAIDEIIRTVRSTTEAPKVCDLVATVASRMRFWRVLAEAQHRPVEVVLPDRAVTIPVSRPELEAALDAVIANVLSHTPEPAGFEVTVIDGGSTGRLIVDDHGPGLHSEFLARGRSGDGGTGLGLDIVRRTAERGGGTIELAARPGGGASVRLSFPTRPPVVTVPAGRYKPLSVTRSRPG